MVRSPGIRSVATIWVLAVALLVLLAGAAVGCAAPERPSPTSDEGSSTPSRSDAADVPAAPIAVKLPAPLVAGHFSLEEAIAERRSVRDFSAAPLTLEELSQLLWAAQGVTSEQGGRAAPSAGGTYPLELLVAVGGVTGLEPAVYRYRPEEHDLLVVRQGDVRAALARASLNQQWVGSAPVDVVITAVYDRTAERYGERGDRYVHLEAGHAAQNVLLQAVALGLGAVPVGAFSDGEVRAVLAAGDEEAPLYVIPVGRLED